MAIRDEYIQEAVRKLVTSVGEVVDLLGQFFRGEPVDPNKLSKPDIQWVLSAMRGGLPELFASRHPDETSIQMPAIAAPHVRAPEPLQPQPQPPPKEIAPAPRVRPPRHIAQPPEPPEAPKPPPQEPPEPPEAPKAPGAAKRPKPETLPQMPEEEWDKRYQAFQQAKREFEDAISTLAAMRAAGAPARRATAEAEARYAELEQAAKELQIRDELAPLQPLVAVMRSKEAGVAELTEARLFPRTLAAPEPGQRPATAGIAAEIQKHIGRIQADLAQGRVGDAQKRREELTRYLMRPEVTANIPALAAFMPMLTGPVEDAARYPERLQALKEYLTPLVQLRADKEPSVTRADIDNYRREVLTAINNLDDPQVAAHAEELLSLGEVHPELRALPETGVLANVLQRRKEQAMHGLLGVQPTVTSAEAQTLRAVGAAYQRWHQKELVDFLGAITRRQQLDPEAAAAKLVRLYATYGFEGIENIAGRGWNRARVQALAAWLEKQLPETSPLRDILRRIRSGGISAAQAGYLLMRHERREEIRTRAGQSEAVAKGGWVPIPARSRYRAELYTAMMPGYVITRGAPDKRVAAFYGPKDVAELLAFAKAHAGEPIPLEWSMGAAAALRQYTIVEPRITQEEKALYWSLGEIYNQLAGSPVFLPHVVEAARLIEPAYTPVEKISAGRVNVITANIQKNVADTPVFY